jgi:hypothetical protein
MNSGEEAQKAQEFPAGKFKEDRAEIGSFRSDVRDEVAQPDAKSLGETGFRASRALTPRRGCMIWQRWSA